jgi:hypothetical protein
LLDGTPVPALETKPELFSDLQWIWDAFCMLNKCRRSGMAGPYPISFIEMQAMANELEIVGETRERFFNRINILDRIFIKHCHEEK